MTNNLAVRISSIRQDVKTLLDYVSPVPLFSSGAEAADHGEREIEQPGEDARETIRKIGTVRELRGKPVNYR